jgi:hypothetical protein
MEIDIGELNSTLQVDGHAPATRQLMRAIVGAIKAEVAQDMRAQSERRVTGGVSQERDEER